MSNTCGTIECETEISYCVSVDVPYPACMAVSSGTGSALICSNNLSCELQRCQQEVTITVTNPCGGVDFPCAASISLVKVIVTGSVLLTVGVPVQRTAAGTECGDPITFARTVTWPVHRIVCVRCDDPALTCEDVFPAGITVTCVAPSIPQNQLVGCGDKTVSAVQGSFTIGGFTC